MYAVHPIMPSQDTQEHCPTCRTPVEPVGVADILAQLADLRDAIVAIGLHLGADGFEADEPEPVAGAS